MSFLSDFKNYLLSLPATPERSDGRRARKTLSKITVKNYIADISKFIRWLAQRSPTGEFGFEDNEVTPELVDLYKKEAQQKFSPSSIERQLSSLRKFFNFLKLEGIVSSSPFEQYAISHKPLAKDPWHLKDFKNYLYVYNASRLTIKNYLIDVKHFLAWTEQVLSLEGEWELGKSNLFSRINSEVIEEYKRRLIHPSNSEPGFSPATVNRKLSSLRKYLAWAQEQGLISEDSDITQNVRLSVKRKIGQSDFSESPKSRPSESFEYSGFPPLRLLQKSLGAGQAVFDFVFVEPPALVLRKIEHLLWKLQGRPVFSKPKIRNSKLEIRNLPKAFYAPLSLSTAGLPIYKRLYLKLRHNRPNWYKAYHSYPLSHYLHYAILIVFMSALGFGLYQNFYKKPSLDQAVLAATPPTGNPRILSFQGKLTDSSDNPITVPTDLRFTIYDSVTASGSALQWQEVNTVTPDQDGIFSLMLGTKTDLGQALFANHAGLWLGVTVGKTPELTPRQQLATVAFAENADTLQGLPPITQPSADTKNVVLALDSSGNLTIGGSATPTFQATGGQFKISGNPLLLTTTAGSNGNVTVNPDGRSFIDLQKPIQNSTNNNNISTAKGAVEIDDLFAVLATSSGQSAVTINQNGAGPIISASSSGIAKFTVDNFGNTTIAGNVSLTGTNPSLSVAGTNSLSIDAGGSGAVSIAGTSTGDVNLAGGSGNTGCTVANATGNLTCTGSISGGSTGTVSSGTFLAGNGTAAAPSYAFTNSTGTGLYRVGADILGITTAGTQRATYDASGNYTLTGGNTSLTSTTTTGNAFSLTDTALTSGTLANMPLTANAGNGQTTIGQAIAITDATTGGGGYTGLSVNITGTGVGTGNKFLLDLNPGDVNKEIIVDSSGALRPTQSVATNTTSIGNASFYFKNGFFDQITANTISGNLAGGGTSSVTWTIGDTQTGDVNEALIFQRNSGSGNATLQWNAGTNDLRYLTVNYPFNSTYTVSDTSIGTGVNLYSGTLTNNTTSGTQKLLSLTNTGTGTTENGIYVNNTGTGTTGIEVAGTWTTGIVTNNNSINTGTGAITSGAITTSGNFSQTGSTTFSTGSGAVSLNGDTTLAVNKVLAVSGTGTITDSYQNTTGSAISSTVTNTATSGLNNTTNAYNVSLTGTANLTGSNVLNGINFNTPTAATNNTFVGLNFNAGYTTLINSANFTVTGAGALTAASVSSTGTTSSTGQFLAANGTAAAPSYAFTNSTGTGLFRAGTDMLGISTAGSQRVTVDSNGNVGIGTTAPVTGGGLTIAPTAVTSGTPSLETIIGPADTTLTAAEANDVNWNLARTVQFTGSATAGAANITTQRAALIQAPTYAFSSTGAQTITNAATLAITGAPVAGTNATITNPYALWVQAGNSLLAGDLTVGQATGVNGRINMNDTLTITSVNVAPNINAINNDLQIKRNGTTVATFATTGVTLAANLLFGTDNTYDIGASGANRPRDIWGGRNIQIDSKLNLGGTNTDYIALGQNPATTGLIRLQNSLGIYGRNAANTADGLIIATNNNNIIIGDSTFTNVGIGTTTPGSILQLGSGQLSVPNGGSTAPGYAFKDDLTTGLYRPGVSQLALTVGAGQRIVTLTTSAFYIGENASGAPLATQTLAATTGSGTNIAGSALIVAGGQSTGSAAGGYIAFQTSAAGTTGSSANTLTERMRIDSSGNVGIGTTAPSQLLTVNAGQVYVTGSQVSGGAGVYTDYSVTTGNGNSYGIRSLPTIANTNTGTLYANWAGAIVNTGVTQTNYYGQYIAAPTLNGTGAITNKYAFVTEASAGNVGIGTTSPGVKLVVAGTTSATSSIKVANTDTTGPENISLGETATDALTPFYIQRTGSTAVSNANSVDIWNANNGYMRFATNNTERMRIDSSGNVGIGIIPSDKLDVFLPTDTAVAFTNGSGGAGDRIVIQARNSGQGNVPIIDMLNEETNGKRNIIMDTTNGLEFNDVTGTSSWIFRTNAGTQRFKIPNTISPATNGVAYSTDANGTLAFTATGGAGTLCLTSASGAAPAWGACSGSAATAWSSLTNPSANLALTMGANTSLFTYNGATGANDLFKLTDTANNTGTGYLLNITTAAGSAAQPVHIVTTAGNKEGLVVDTGGGAGAGIILRDINSLARSIALNQDGNAGYLTGGNLGTGAANGFWITGASSTLKLNTDAANPIVFYTNGSAAANERMRIDSAGNVGIGTTSPAALFHVNAASGNGIMITESSGTVGNNAGVFDLATYTPNAADQRLGYYIFGTRPASTTRSAASIEAYSNAAWTDGTSQPTYLSFFTTPASSATRLERVRIDPSGNVGIGTTTPSSLLHIKNASGQAVLRIESAGGATTPQIVFYASGTQQGQVLGDGTGLYMDSTGNSPVYLRANGATGRIGVSTSTSPATNGVAYSTDTLGTIQYTATGGAGTLCLVSTAGGAPTWGSCAGSAATAWSSLTNPSANLSLSMGANTTTFTWGATTGANNLFTLTDTASNTGTGKILQITSASGSNTIPLDVKAGTVNADVAVFETNNGSGGDIKFFDANLSVPRGYLGHGGNIANGALISDFVLRSEAALKFVTGGAGAVRTTFDSTGNITLTPGVSTSGSPTLLTLTGPAHTTLAASTEATDVNLNLARTVQFSTGALTTQRAVRIQAPTYAFVGASTITNAATLSISGAPAAGTNATITNPAALVVESGNVGIGTLSPSSLLDVNGGRVRVSGTNSAANPYGILVDQTQSNGSGTDTGIASNPTFSATTGSVYGFYTQPVTAASAITVTNMYGTYIANPTKGAGSTITNNYGLYVESPTSGTNNYAAIFAGGNVGVDTTAPTQALDVNGNIRVRNLSQANGVLYTDATGLVTQTATGGAGTLCLTSTGGGSPVFASCAGSGGTTTTAWSSLGGPAANLSMSMAAYTTTLTWNSLTGTSNLFNLTDSGSNNGTGYLMNLTTAAGSTLNPLHVSVNGGTEALAVASSGNVGIGTTAPAQLLTVMASSGTPTIRLEQSGAGGRRWDFAADSSGNLTISDVLSYGSFFAINGGSNATSVIGGGTTSAFARLRITGTITASSATARGLFIDTGESAAANNDALYGQFIDTTLTSGSFTGLNGYGLRIRPTVSGAGFSNQYGLYVDTPSGATNNYAAVFAGGNVGIGTTSPTSPLHVVGSSSNLSGASQTGAIIDSTFTSAATTQGVGLQINYGAVASSFTMTNLYGLYINPTTPVGTTPTITNWYGAYIGQANLNGKPVTNSYSLYAAPNVNAGKSYGVYVGNGGQPLNSAGGFAISICGSGGGGSVVGCNLAIGTDNNGVSNGQIGNIIAIANSNNTPGATAGQGFIYVSSGALKYQGPTTLTTLANADYAESMPFIGELNQAEIASISNVANPNSDLYNKFYIQRTSVSYDPNIVGVVSSASPETKTDTRQIAMIGRVPVKSTNENGVVKAGDYLTSSAKMPGYAMKATKAGRVIGVALNDFEQGSCTTSSSNFGLIGTLCTGQVLVFVNPGYYDANPPIITTIQNAAIYVISKLSNGTYQVKDAAGNLVGQAQVLASAVIGQVNAGIVKTQELIADKISAGQVTSPLAIVNKIKTDEISNLTSDKVAIKLENPTGSASAKPRLEIQNASGSAVATFDASGNLSASGSGTFNGDLKAKRVYGEAVQAESASVSGTLKAKNVQADNIDASISNLKTQISKLQPISIASYSAQLNVANLNAATAMFSQGFSSLGPASLTNTSIFGQLSISGTLILADNSINVLGGDLNFQPLKQGGVSFLSGKIYISSNGELAVSGNATIKGNLYANVISPIPGQDLFVKLLNKNATESAQFKVVNASGSAVLAVNDKGDLTSSGSAKFNDLFGKTFNIVREAQADTSLNETVASSSAGFATIVAGQLERTIITPYVLGNSLIYLSPASDTQRETPYIARQTVEDKNLGTKASFTIRISKAVSQDIRLNWWIIN